MTFSQIVQSGVDVEPAPGPHTAAALAADLAEDTRYCWRVRSDDRQATSPYSFACFLVSERNDPPSVPVLNTPSDTLAATTTFPVFSWGPSTDPEGAAVSYEVEVTDGDGQLVAQVQGASGTVTPIPGELVNGAIYQWRARATDAAGLSSEWSPQSAFAVDAPVDEPPVDDRDDIGACHAGGGASAGGLGALVVVAAALASRRRRRGVGLGLVCAAGLVGGPSLARAQTPGDTAAPPAAATPRAGVPTGLAVEVRLDSGQTFLDDDFVIPSFSSGLHLGYRARSVIVGLGLEAPSA